MLRGCGWTRKPAPNSDYNGFCFGRSPTEGPAIWNRCHVPSFHTVTRVRKRAECWRPHPEPPRSGSQISRDFHLRPSRPGTAGGGRHAEDADTTREEGEIDRSLDPGPFAPVWT